MNPGVQSDTKSASNFRLDHVIHQAFNTHMPTRKGSSKLFSFVLDIIQLQSEAKSASNFRLDHVIHQAFNTHLSTRKGCFKF